MELPGVHVSLAGAALSAAEMADVVSTAVEAVLVFVKQVDV